MIIEGVFTFNVIIKIKINGKLKVDKKEEVKRKKNQTLNWKIDKNK